MTVVIANRYGVSTNQLQIRVGKAAPPIVWSPAESIPWGAPLDAQVIYNPVTPLPGLFTFEPPLGSLLEVGSHTLRLTFAPFDPLNYQTVVLNRPLLVVKAGQKLEFSAPERAVLGDSPINLTAAASSRLPVEFELLSGPGTVNGNVLTPFLPRVILYPWS